MEKELMFKAKEYLLEHCYADIYVLYFSETDELFIKFNFDGIEIKITAKKFIEKIHDNISIATQMDDALKRARFILCNVITNRYFN